MDYAMYLHDVEKRLTHSASSSATWTGSGRPATSCCGPWERIKGKPGLKAGTEFFRFAENLAW